MITQINNHKIMGYTLIEVLVTMVVLTTLTAALVSSFLDTSQKRADVVVTEMWMISKAVQAYDTQVGDFPASSTLCANAIGVLTSSGLLAGISTTASPWSATSKYVTNCAAGENLMTLSINTNTEWAKYIAKALPATSINSATATLNIPKLAYSAVLNNSLLLNPAVVSTLDFEYNNTVNSPSGTYVARGALDMNSFSILNPSPTLRGDVDNQPIVVSSIATGAVPATAADVIRVIDGIIEFDTTISDTNMELDAAASNVNTYRYARIEAIAHVAGNYTFRLGGTRVGATFNTGRASRTLTVDSVDQNQTLNLAKGEIITLRVYQFTGIGASTGASLRVREPGETNFTNVGESSGLVVLGNLPKINTAYSYFAIWAEDDQIISTAENFGFQWAFGDNQRTFNNGIVMPFEVELIALGVSLSDTTKRANGANPHAIVEAYRNHDNSTTFTNNPGGTGRTVRINLTSVPETEDNNEIVSFEDAPVTYSAGDFFSFRTVGSNNVPAASSFDVEGAIVVAWFRTRLQ